MKPFRCRLDPHLGLDPARAPSRMSAPQWDDLRSSTGLAASRLVLVWDDLRFEVITTGPPPPPLGLLPPPSSSLTWTAPEANMAATWKWREVSVVTLFEVEGKLGNS